MVWFGKQRLTDHCKVVWVCRGYKEDIPCMYDRPLRLCRWWVKEHKRDSQYAQGKFNIVTLAFERKTS